MFFISEQFSYQNPNLTFMYQWDYCFDALIVRKPHNSKLLAILCFARHMHEQINHTVGIAPLIVVPRYDFEEALLAGQVVL